MFNLNQNHVFGLFENLIDYGGWFWLYTHIRIPDLLLHFIFMHKTL